MTLLLPVDLNPDARTQLCCRSSPQRCSTGLSNTRLSFGHIRPKKIPTLDHLLGDVIVFTDLHVAENVGQLLGYEHFDLIHRAT